MKGPDERQVRAAQALARGGTLQVAAEAAGVNRATVVRWRQTESFRSLQAQEASRPPDSVADIAVQGLEALVPKALALLEAALLPGSQITGTSAKNALDIIKQAAVLKREEGSSGGGTLESILTELDEVDGEPSSSD